MVSFVSRVLVMGLGELLGFDRKAFDLRRGCLGFCLCSAVVTNSRRGDYGFCVLCFYRDF